MPRAPKSKKTASSPKTTRNFHKIQDVKLEVEERGRGRPLLLLQGEETHEAEMPFVDELAKK
ncbi:MAG: hypothetical protein ACTSQV_06790, partial [Alphaproteobacteria bacterium]